MGAGNIYIKPIEVNGQVVCNPDTFYIGEELFTRWGWIIDEENFFDEYDWDLPDVCAQLEISFKKKFPDFEFGENVQVADVFSEIRNSNGTLVLEEKHSLVQIVAGVSAYDVTRVAFGIIPCSIDRFIDYAVYYGSAESEAFARKYGIPEGIDPEEEEPKIVKAYKKFIKQYYAKQATVFKNYLKTSPNFRGTVSIRTSAWTSGLL